MLHRQHNSYAQYTACLQCIYMHNKENLRFIQIHAAAVRIVCPALSLSLHFVKLSCLCSAVLAARQARSLHCRSLPSLSCDGFGALLEVFRIQPLTLQNMNQKAVHMNIIMWFGFLFSLNIRLYHIIIFMCTAFWSTFCQVNANSCIYVHYNNSKPRNSE